VLKLSGFSLEPTRPALAVAGFLVFTGSQRLTTEIHNQALNRFFHFFGKTSLAIK
jgi:hypothetical protein